MLRRYWSEEINLKMDMKDLVSIIMPSYNTGQFIGETIKSVQDQTYRNWELLIVDDCSTDNTDEVVKQYLKDERIHYFKNEKNSGAAVSRNQALRKAKGRWIAFLDSDDIWHSEKLKWQIHFMRKRNCYFSYTEYEEIDERSVPLGVVVKGPRRVTKWAMYAYCWPGCLTVMYDRNVIGDVQIRDIRKNNDYAIWLKVCQKADCYLCPKVMARYRKRTGSISNHSYLELVKWHYKLWREAEGRTCVISLLYTFCNIFFGVIKKSVYVDRSRKYDIHCQGQL